MSEQAGHQSGAPKQGTPTLPVHPVPALATPSAALDLENEEKQPGLGSQVAGEGVSLFMDM